MTLRSSDVSTHPSADSATSSTHHARSSYETVFNRLTEAVGDRLSPDHHFTLSIAGEDSQFTRFNQAKVRQTGQVCDGQLRLTLMTATQTAAATVPFIGEFDTDWAIAQQALTTLQAELPHLPVDPYIVLPSPADVPANGRSREVRGGDLLPAKAIAETLLSPVQMLDFSGLYAAGLSYRAYSDSAGKRHWFETLSFTLDYSLFGDRPHQAVKGTLAGRHWHRQTYQQNIAAAQQQLALSLRPIKAIPKGRYRTYLAPAAVADLMETVIYGGLGEAALRQGNSAFSKLEQGEAILSEQFSLGEDFQRAGVPRFNTSGQVAPTQLPIIQAGRWDTSLVNARSAKEYGKPSNAANARETLRAPALAPGQLHTDQVLAELGTGLYLSNLHYLNWSDLTAGRITGMTRYACFWVENGEIVAPIENLRFDDDFYRFLGEGLIALSDRLTFLPAVGTYERRSLGGMWMPGMLIDQFRYTL
ncbi:MAG: metallopeptidase TldD-related protein [Phormidesmis sp.]